MYGNFRALLKVAQTRARHQPRPFGEKLGRGRIKAEVLYNGYNMLLQI